MVFCPRAGKLALLDNPGVLQDTPCVPQFPRRTYTRIRSFCDRCALWMLILQDGGSLDFRASSAKCSGSVVHYCRMSLQYIVCYTIFLSKI